MVVSSGCKVSLLKELLINWTENPSSIINIHYVHKKGEYVSTMKEHKIVVNECDLQPSLYFLVHKLYVWFLKNFYI